MAPIPVFIDTSSLPRHPGRLGAAFERLKQLTNDGVVKVYLSDVVVKEWKSQLEAELSEYIEKAKTAIVRVAKHPWAIEIDNNDVFDSASSLLSISTDKLEDLSGRKVSEILQTIQAELHTVKEHHGNLVINSYFAGVLPFKSRKSREDFPDAFIFESAKDIKGMVENLHCVIADSTLSEALSQLEGFILYGSIKEFVQSEIIVSITIQQEKERNWQAVLGVIRATLHERKEELDKELLDMYFEAIKPWVYHSRIPDDNNEAYISSVDEPTHIEFDWETIQDFGSGIITLPFSIECPASIRFSVFRGDAFTVSDKVWVEIVDPEEQHYFDAGGMVDIQVIGTLSILFDTENLSPDVFPKIEEVKINEIISQEIIEDINGSIFH